MSATKFTPEIRGEIIERTSAGVSLRDIGHATGVQMITIQKWLRRGREEEAGEFAEFAAAVDSARKAANDRPEPLTDDEHARLVAKAARNGSVAALKLAWEMILADRNLEPEEEGPTDPLAELDELAARRAA